MATLCRECWRGKLGVDHDPPSVRTGKGPCDFCGREGPNYTYPDELIPGMKNNVDMAADAEERM